MQGSKEIYIGTIHIIQTTFALYHCTNLRYTTYTKKLQEVTFYIVQNDGSVLLSCTTILVLGLIHLTQDLIICHPELAWLQAQLTTPRRPREHLFTAQERKCLLKAQNKQLQFPSWWQARNKIYKATQVFLMALNAFHVPHTTYHPSITSKQTPCRPIMVHLKEAFKQEIDKMLRVGVLEPVHEATQWINSFVLVEQKTRLVT